MAKFKIGDKVKVKRLGSVGSIEYIYHETTPQYKIEYNSIWFYESELELLSDGWQQGDVLVNQYKHTATIMGVCGEVIFVYFNDLNSLIINHTKDSLTKLGYKPLSETPLEVTLEQVAEKFGVDKIKIK
jgi:hypothetical protein